MPTIKSFEEMDIWKAARLLNKEIIILLDNEFVKKDFRFRDQIRAASVSIMDNIAEGFERQSRLEFINFLSYSKGSIGEVRSQLIRGIDMNYRTENNITELKTRFEILSSHIANFIKYLNATEIKGIKFKDRC